MTYYANDVHPIPPDHGSSDCDDQLPLISRVGRGIKGDSYRVAVGTDSTNETYLNGMYYDNASKTWHTDWVSENINGGELKYQYNLRPGTIPRTFTITFKYIRPGRDDAWVWTTPAIPYIWSVDPAGKPDEDPDHIVGTGVATLFISNDSNNWTEKLIYPNGWTRKDFNAPNQGEAWTVNLDFGPNGLDFVDFDELAKILGIPKTQLRDIINKYNQGGITLGGIGSSDNLVDFIKDQDSGLLSHFHKDLGFATPISTPGHTGNAFGTSPITNASYSNVKAYIDAADNALSGNINDLASDLSDLEGDLNNLKGKVGDLINALNQLIYNAPLNSDGTLKSNYGTGDGKRRVPSGNLNIYSTNSKEIRTHAGNEAGDLKTN